MKKVLVVDDSALARKTLLRCLPAGFDADVQQLDGGACALDACRTAQPDLVFLDLNMPAPDGYEVLRQLRDAGSMPFVIVVSADVQPQAQARVLELGARAFVKKPSSKEELAEALRACGML